MSDVTEKLQELQENIQKLQILKSIGANSLVVTQEKEVYRIQQEILDIDRNQAIDVVDAILPKKCRFCKDKNTPDEKFECFEKNGETCKKKAPAITNLFSSKIIRLVVTVSLVLVGLLAFFLMTNIFMTYIENNNLIVFFLVLGCMSILVILFWKSVKKLYQAL